MGRVMPLSGCSRVSACSSRYGRRRWRSRRRSPAWSPTGPGRCCQASPWRHQPGADREGRAARVTDGTGQYRIVGLPSGAYTLAYTLTGFNTVKREGVEVAGNLTATINIELRVGALEESIVVTGESPIVDVQSARRQQVITGEVLATLPTSRSYNSVLQLVPSVVAGDGNVQLRPTMLLFTAHGGSTQDGRLTVDGVNTGSSRGGSGVSSYVPDVQNATEVAFTISGNLGEAETGGPQMIGRAEDRREPIQRLVLRQRRERGACRAATSRARLQARGPDRAAQGDQAVTTCRRRAAARSSAIGVVLLQLPPLRVGRRAAGDLRQQERGRSDEVDLRAGPRACRAAPTSPASIYALRLTWQATPRNKLMGFFDYQPECTSGAWIEDSGACRNVRAR